MDKVLSAIVEIINSLVSNNESPLYFDGKPVATTDTPHGVRRVFYGDPQQIPSDDFPCISVRPVNSKIVSEGTRTDTWEHVVEVIIIENLRNYSESVPDDPSKVQSLATMMDMMEKTDDNMVKDSTSIVGAMITPLNQRLPYQNSGTKYAAVSVRHDAVDYVFNSSRGFPTFEVVATFTVTAKSDRA